LGWEADFGGSSLLDRPIANTPNSICLLGPSDDERQWIRIVEIANPSKLGLNSDATSVAISSQDTQISFSKRSVFERLQHGSSPDKALTVDA